ncbi:MAG TPA: site-specific integrase [Thermomicrobiales bacterium]|nr:site-specific integrase [Thermomicrobiales bacterium]
MARGSITPRPTKDGKVRYRVKWESRGPDGSRRHHSATRATKKAAEALLAEKLDEVNEGTFVVASKETVGQYLQRWLSAASFRYADATVYQYEREIRLRIVPRLGGVALSKLDQITIQSMYATLLDSKTPAATVLQTHKVLHTALAQAVAWRLLIRNPADGVSIPRVEPSAPIVWTPDEAGAFLISATTEKDPLLPLWELGLDSGMRIGEMLALSWSDVDRQRGLVSVRRTLTGTREGWWKIGEHAKTSSSRRAIDLSPFTMAALRSWGARQAERRLAAGEHWQDMGLVFDRGNGHWINPNTVRNAFDRAVSTAKVTRITPHGMRHTMATLLLGAGVHPKIVQERLGHSSIQMTLDRYSHVSMSMQQQATEVLADVLHGGRLEDHKGRARPKRGHESG